MSRNKSNLKFQMMKKADSIAKIGLKKKETKKIFKKLTGKYETPYIHGVKTLQNYKDELNRFCTWLKDNGFSYKNIVDIPRSTFSQYLQSQKERGLSAYTVHFSMACINKIFNTDGIKNIYAYLLYTIGLDVEFIDYLKDNDLIFAEDNGEKIKNIIFPHYEEIKENSIIDLVGYDVYGTLSDKKFCRCETFVPFSNFFIDDINYNPANKHYVYIFESDLDLICFYYLYERGLIDIDDFILISIRGRFKEIIEKYVNENSVIVNCINDFDFSISLLHYKDIKSYNNIYGCSEFFKNKEFKSFKEMVKYKEIGVISSTIETLLNLLINFLLSEPIIEFVYLFMALIIIKVVIIILFPNSAEGFNKKHK